MCGEGHVVQRFLRDRTQTTQRIDRHAPGDDGTRRVQACGLAIAQCRRTVGFFQALHIEQTVGQIVLVGLVVAVADIPVEVAAGELEEAFETTVEVPVLDVLVERTATGFIEATIDALQFDAIRVVHAVRAQVHASDRHGGQ